MSILNFKNFSRSFGKLCDLSFGLWGNFFLLKRMDPLKTLGHYSSGNNFELQENKYSQLKLLDVHLPDASKPLRLHPLWLRDHCRCSECYNDVTCQRKNDILKLNEQITISTHSQRDGLLQICWSDGHKSSFSIPWLVSNTYEEKYKILNEEASRLTTWDGTTVNLLKLEPILHQRIMNDDEMLPEIYRRVIQYGFVKIEQVPPTKFDTNMVIERICRMSNTVFGNLWETGTNFDHKDTGYLNGYLEAHTDNTYFTEAQGLLVFHCTHFNGTGCESILVDGFHIANQLKQLDPSAYEYLSKVNTEAEYIEPGEHFSSWSTIFRHHPLSHKLEQIRFNLLDRAPLSSVPQSEVDTYYRHLNTMAMLVKKKENEYKFHLSPGTVMIIDNWRLLHGRGSYQGERVLRGCYYSRSDFMSKARHFGIIS